MTNPLAIIDPRRLTDNAFKLIADDWMLITAGTRASYNTMTASWGAVGELWNKKICICFVRPTRHTYQFIERSSVFSLSFFDEKYREVLRHLGTVSGRDVDKMTIAGLTPIVSEHGAIYFAEARLVFECRKIYSDDLRPGQFLAPEIADCYPRKDYHRFYIGEILTCQIRNST